MLLSDIGMSGEDGYSFIRRVRSLPPDRGGLIPAVAITAYATAGDRALAMSSVSSCTCPSRSIPSTSRARCNA